MASVAAVTKEMKTGLGSPVGSHGPYTWAGHRQPCSQGDECPSATCGHPCGFRKGPHIPRASIATYWQTSPSIILLYVFKIILCNAPRMSELLCELTGLHIFHLISGNSDRQGPWPCLSMSLLGGCRGSLSCWWTSSACLHPQLVFFWFSLTPLPAFLPLPSS